MWPFRNSKKPIYTFPDALERLRRIEKQTTRNTAQLRSIEGRLVNLSRGRAYCPSCGMDRTEYMDDTDETTVLERQARKGDWMKVYQAGYAHKGQIRARCHN